MKKAVMTMMLMFGAIIGYGSEEISYPPKQQESQEETIESAWNGLITEVSELGTMIVSSVIKEGGVIPSVKKHIRFYGSIGLFCILFFVWNRHRDR